MRDLESVTRRPSGLSRRSPWSCRIAPPEPGIAVPEGDQQQAESAEKRQNDKHPGNDQRTDRLRRHPQRRIAPTRQRARRVRTSGFAVRSIRSTGGGGGVDFITKIKPQGHCLRERVKSIARVCQVLARCRTDVLTRKGSIGAQMRRKPQFSTGSHFVMCASSARLEPHWAQRRTCEVGRLRSAYFHRCVLDGWPRF